MDHQVSDECVDSYTGPYLIELVDLVKTNLLAIHHMRQQLSSPTCCWHYTAVLTCALSKRKLLRSVILILLVGPIHTANQQSVTGSDWQ